MSTSNIKKTIQVFYTNWGNKIHLDSLIFKSNETIKILETVGFVIRFGFIFKLGCQLLHLFPNLSKREARNWILDNATPTTIYGLF